MRKREREKNNKKLGRKKKKSEKLRMSTDDCEI